MEYQYLSSSTEQTKLFARNLAKLLQPGSVLTLEGDLGAGKTTFTKGLAEGLEIKKVVNSPTFTIIKEYHDGAMPLYHMDVYRLEDEHEDLGFDEYFNGNGATVVEWAHLINDQLPFERLSIYLTHSGDDARTIKLIPSGAQYEEICKEIFK
ncbi:tRNA (adenosine(37)-N6)-threonylcarbamoyltransferase complex ATPase subunit type 1 TsaE [Pseudoneobacillus sp. C159]